MDRENGLKQIDEAKWDKDQHGYRNLYVTDAKGNVVHCFLSLRPNYCDRGHIQLNIDALYLCLDHSDSFPRFFFSFEEADIHTRLFLKWRLWKHRVHEHKL